MRLCRKSSDGLSIQPARAGIQKGAGRFALFDGVMARGGGSERITQANRRLHIRMAGQSVVVPTDGIAMLAAEADITRIVMADGRDYLACRLLGQFDAELPTPPFFRISRSLVINLDRVEHVRSRSCRSGRA